MTEKLSFRELTRSPEGEIGRAQYIDGLKVVGLVSALVLGLFYGAYLLRQTMDWMTVAVAPVYGVLLFFAVSSLVYFWYCLFAKRFRALEASSAWIILWLVAMLAAATAALMGYQAETLGISDSTMLNLAQIAVWPFVIVSVACFLNCVFRGLGRSE